MKAFANMALGMCVVAGAASAAHAVLITNGSGTTLFYDDFEGVSDGSVPVAKVGTWSKSGSPVVESGNPQAYQGNNYLQITRPAASFADFGDQTSGTLHSEFMLYIRSANFANYGAQMMVRNSALSAYGIILSPMADGSVDYYNGSGYSVSNASFAFDTWQKWTIDINLGTDTYNFSVAGTPGLTSADSLHDGATDLQYLVFGSGGGTNPQYLVDAVPEPASLSLLALGGIALMGYRRRR